jgi:enoyl-CoA hydratase
MPGVTVRLDNGIGWLTLTDPDRRNILSAGMVDELVAAIDAVEADESVHAVVVTGAGSAFCAGADLGDLLAAADGVTAPVQRVYQGFLRVARCALPTVAAVNGPAVGAGLNLALACDVRIVAEGAWFESRFQKIGLHPGGGCLWMLERLVGPQTAAAMTLFGQRLSAERAVRTGLALSSVPAADLPERARLLAAAAAATDRELLRRTKATLRRVIAEPALTHDEAVDLETEAQFWSLRLPSTVGLLRELRGRISG